MIDRNSNLTHDRVFFFNLKFEWIRAEHMQAGEKGNWRPIDQKICADERTLWHDYRRNFGSTSQVLDPIRPAEMLKPITPSVSKSNKRVSPNCSRKTIPSRQSHDVTNECPTTRTRHTTDKKVETRARDRIKTHIFKRHDENITGLHDRLTEE